MSKLYLLSDAQRATLESWTSFTESALLQVLSGIAPGDYNLYRVSDVIAGTVTAALVAPSFKALGTWANGSSGSTSVNWPTHVADDVGILIEVFRADSTPGALSAGWTLLGDLYTLSSTRRRLRLSWKRAASNAETAATLTSSAGGRTAAIITFSGCVTTGTPVELIGGDGSNSAATTAVSIPSGAGPTLEPSLIMPIFVTDQAAGGTSLLSGGFVNSDLTSIVSRAEYVSPGQAQGIYIATANRAAAGAMANTIATLTAAQKIVSATLAFFPK